MFKLVFHYVQPVLFCFVLSDYGNAAAAVAVFSPSLCIIRKAVQAAAACLSSDGKQTRCIYVISFDDKLISRVAGRGRHDAS